MMAAKLIQLLAACTTTIIITVLTTPAQAISLDSHGQLMSRHVHIAQGLSVQKKRATGRKCKNRPPAFPVKSTSKSASKTSSKAPKPTKEAVKNNNPPSYKGGKMCLPWPNGDDPNLKKFKTDKVGVLYTWNPRLPSQAKKLGFKAVPMLWGANQVADFERLVKPGYADTILGFNEPNLDSQSGLNPAEAAKLWKDHIQTKKKYGYRLISPATTSAPSGIDWLQDMLDECKGACTFDAIAVHWYGTSADEFIAYVEKHHKKFNKPIWVTEFACQDFNRGAQCTKDQIFNFASKVTRFMDNTDYVEVYCPFGVQHDMVNVNPLNQLMKPNGDPTDLAWSYMT
jgi:hypothetical protein